MINCNYEYLTGRMDVSGGLLDEMLGVGLINDRQRRSFQVGRENYYDHNEVILDFVSRLEICPGAGQEKVELFLSALERSDQGHLVRYMRNLQDGATIDLEDLDLPLSDEETRAIDGMESYLAQILRPTDELLTKLVDRRCITATHRGALMMIGTGEALVARSRDLLTVVKRRSKRAVRSFPEALREDGQSGAAEVFERRGGYIVPVHVTLATKDSLEIDRLETKICKLTKLLGEYKRSRSMSPQEAAALVQDLLVSVYEFAPAELVSCDRGCSVVLSLYCASKDILRTVLAAVNSGAMEAVVRRLVSVYLADEQNGHAGVESVEVYPSDLDRLKRWLPPKAGLHPGGPMVIKRRRTSSGSELQALQALQMLGTVESFEEIPFELQEIILRKAAINLIMRLAETSVRPQVLVYQSLALVCPAWRRNLNKQRRWKQYVDRCLKAMPTFGPYKLTVRQEGGDIVPSAVGGIKGIAVLGSHLYVASDKSSQISQFQRRPPFNQLDIFKVGGLNFPCDLAACEALNRLYVGDSNNDCVHVIDAASRMVVQKIPDVQWPLQLSVTADGRVLTVDDYGLFMVFSPARDLLHKISLPAELTNPWQVAMKPSGNFLVCCGKVESDFHGVAEFALVTLQNTRCPEDRRVACRVVARLGGPPDVGYFSVPSEVSYGGPGASTEKYEQERLGPDVSIVSHFVPSVPVTEAELQDAASISGLASSASSSVMHSFATFSVVKASTSDVESDPHAFTTAATSTVSRPDVAAAVSRPDVSAMVSRPAAIPERSKVEPKQMKVDPAFSERRGYLLNSPRCLALGRNGSDVFVGDRKNHRVVLLDAELTRMRVLLTPEIKGPKKPFRICYDDSKGRLFVGDQYEGVVRAYDVVGLATKT